MIVGEFKFYPWTLASPHDHRQRDPLNLFFLGQLATLHEAIGIVADVLGAGPTTLGNDQWFEQVGRSYSFVHRHDSSLGTARQIWPVGARIHLRLYAGDAGGVHPILAASIHRDALSGCGDVATSFDGPREWAAERFVSAGYELRRVRDKERASVGQCDGSRVPTDGWSVVVSRAGS